MLVNVDPISICFDKRKRTTIASSLQAQLRAQNCATHRRWPAVRAVRQFCATAQLIWFIASFKNKQRGQKIVGVIMATTSVSLRWWCCCWRPSCSFENARSCRPFVASFVIIFTLVNILIYPKTFEVRPDVYPQQIHLSLGCVSIIIGQGMISQIMLMNSTLLAFGGGALRQRGTRPVCGLLVHWSPCRDVWWCIIIIIIIIRDVLWMCTRVSIGSAVRSAKGRTLHWLPVGLTNGVYQRQLSWAAASLQSHTHCTVILAFTFTSFHWTGC